MEIENPNPATSGDPIIAEEDEVEEEIDVYVRVPKRELYMLHFPLRPYDTGFTKYESIEYISGKPQQNRVKIGMSVNPECENYARTGKGITYEMESKVINNRTNYCVGKIKEGSLILLPVNYCLQMRKSFADLDEKFRDPKKAKKEETKTENKRDSFLEEASAQFRKRENLKQIERKMRTYPFQREILESESEIPLRFVKKESPETSKLIQALLDPPIGAKELKFLDKNEYLKYLF